MTYGSLFVEVDLSWMKHVLSVLPLSLTSPCLVTKQCLMVFGHQTFPVWTGLTTTTLRNQSLEGTNRLRLFMNYCSRNPGKFLCAEDGFLKVAFVTYIVSKI